MRLSFAALVVCADVTLRETSSFMLLFIIVCYLALLLVHIVDVLNNFEHVSPEGDNLRE